MSKKQTPNRLENLFSDLEQKEFPSLEKRPLSLAAWTWEVDREGLYIGVSPEVQEGLAFSPLQFIGQSLHRFSLTPRSLPTLQNALNFDNFPTEIDVEYTDRQGSLVQVRMNLFRRFDENGEANGWRGFNQVIARIPAMLPPGSLPAAPAEWAKPKTTEPSHDHSVMKGGIALQNGFSQPSDKPWTEVAQTSLARKETLTQTNTASGAALVVPFQMSGKSQGIIEILDENAARHWSDDDRTLAEDVARQLALALENAQLYATVQQELSERARAEKETLKRNQELSLLNQVGQQLSKLTSQQELLNLVQKSIGEIVDHRNLTIALYNSAAQIISFPIHTENGQPVFWPDAHSSNQLIDYMLRQRERVIIHTQAADWFTEHHVSIPNPLPRSILGIPLLAGERPVGAIVLQDFAQENAYTPVEAELLSTIAAQATTALENSNLFQEITNALQSLETRERYQANIARGVATLTQYGSMALADVLNTLSAAARNSHTYYAALEQDENGPYWRAVSEWHNPNNTSPQPSSDLHHLPANRFPFWSAELQNKGWMSGTVQDLPSPEREYLGGRGVSSILLLAVPGKQKIPSFLAFEQTGDPRIWQSEEINVLRVAADALANTIVREDLLERVQESLDETENLYNASHRLALASDLNEMVAALAQDMRIAAINRGVLVLFDYDQQGKMGKISVAANWHSGSGTPPLPNGTEFPQTIAEQLFFIQTPAFIDDIYDSQNASTLRDIMTLQNVRSLALLPVWASKRQLGILLLESEIKHVFTGRETRSYPPLVDQMATAIENQKLFEQTQAALAETGVLYQISNSIAQANNPAELTSLIATHLLPKHADRVAILFSNQTPNGQVMEYEVVGYYDLKKEASLLGLKYSNKDLPILKGVSEVIMASDLSHSTWDPASKRTFLAQGVQSICLIPLHAAGKALGFLAISARRGVEFGGDEIRLLQVASGGFAVALEKYQLLKETQRRALELQTAAEIARDTTGTLAIDQLLSRIVNLLKERFNFYHVAVYLLDTPRNFAIVREASGEAGQELKQRGHRLAVGSRSIIGSISASGTTLAIPDVSQSPIYYAHQLLPETRGEIGIPLKSGDKVIGVLDLQYNHVNAFNQNDLVVLQILADQIAVAIENAEAYELSQRAYEEMKEVDRVKSQFLANMSHELRTPLNSIIGFSRVIIKGIDGPINETQREDLSAIYNSGQHLLTLINNILDLSKIEAGKMELQLSEVNITDTINSVMSTAVGLVKDKPVKLHQNVPSDIPLVKADQTRVRQILLNLVSNASKFTEEGSITVAASVVKSPKGRKEVMLTITDTGKGIAEEDQSKLFQPFSQVDDSPTRKTGGTGLGLSICRSMVEMHGGQIGLQHSVVGKGSTFYFTLPLALSDEPEPEIVTAANLILAIDDDAQVISLYQRYLKPQGYQVVALTNPKEAVARAKELRPYAITLDIMMPEMDGWQVLNQLKSDPETRDIPIVICSILEDEEKGFNLGAADYLTKPFLQEELILTVNRVNKHGSIHHILVIDDDPTDLRLVQKMLEESGKFQVTLAEGGKKGWEEMLQNRPDAVVLDLFMPDLDGFTLLNHMRSTPQLSDLPVIVLTGADLTPEQHVQMAQLGQQIITKSLLRERELMVALETALRKIRE